VPDAVLTMRSLRQLVATHGNGFGLFSGTPALSRLAADCQRLQPRGSIRAPSLVVKQGDSGGEEPPRSGRVTGRSPNQRHGHLIPRASRTPVIFANRKNGRVALQRMDNVGIVVESLDAAISLSPSWASNSRGKP
jgi:hypothetical protein